MNILHHAGRIKLTTDVRKITKDNVIEVLQAVLPLHQQNSQDIDFLIKYERGNQPLTRIKSYRKDIDCHCVDNVANEIAEFKEGFHWGNPITLIQNDTGDEDKTKAIASFNRQFEIDGYRAKTQSLGMYVEIAGIACEYIDINEQYMDGDSFITTIPLDPRTSFVVYSSYYTDKRKMMGVTFRNDNLGNKFCTCVTPTNRYEVQLTVVGNSIITGRHLPHSGEKNPFGIINIVEWQRYCDRMGCFERQISELDNLNLLVSDFSNDVDQNTQAIWHGNDIQFPKNDENKDQEPQTGDWVLTQTTKNGHQPFIKPLAVTYDYKGMLDNIITRRAMILEKCNVPNRNSTSGGSTGIAMSDATGWSAAEMAASKVQPFQESAKMEEAKIALAIIKKSPDVPANSELLTLNAGDMKANIKRQKTYEMTTKINAFATGVSHGINGQDMLANINLFDDPNEVWLHSQKTIEAFQKSNFTDKAGTAGEGGEGEPKPDKGRLDQDPSDQINNSPSIDSSRATGNN